MTPRPRGKYIARVQVARKLLDGSRAEQESTGGGDPCWVQAGLTMLQKRSCLYMLTTARMHHHHHGINLLAQFCTCTRVCELLDRSSEEQESARGEPGLVHAGLMTLQECSCPHAHLKYSACACVVVMLACAVL